MESIGSEVPEIEQQAKTSAAFEAGCLGSWVARPGQQSRNSSEPCLELLEFLLYSRILRSFLLKSDSSKKHVCESLRRFLQFLLL